MNKTLSETNGHSIWLRRLVYCLSTRRPEFDTRAVFVTFVVYKVALREIYLPNVSLVSYQHNSTSAAYSFIYSSSTLNSFSN